MANKAFMEYACDMAKKASEKGEVPVGAIIVRGEEIISCSGNDRENSHDATAHAEIVCIRQACEKLGSWHLDDCEIFVTLEPCPMCMGALINSRIKKITFGAKDPKAGACGSVINLNNYPLNHKPEIEYTNSDECKNILSDFFKNKR